MKLKVLEEAFTDPDAALRVARRHDRALQACVTISPTRRAMALKLLAEKQRDMNADPAIRTAACWLSLELGGTDLPALEESIAFLCQPRDKHYLYLKSFCRAVLKSPSAPRQITPALNSMIDLLSNSTANYFYRWAARDGPKQLWHRYWTRLTPPKRGTRWSKLTIT